MNDMDKLLNDLSTAARCNYSLRPILEKYLAEHAPPDRLAVIEEGLRRIKKRGFGEPYMKHTGCGGGYIGYDGYTEVWYYGADMPRTTPEALIDSLLPVKPESEPKFSGPTRLEGTIELYGFRYAAVLTPIDENTDLPGTKPGK